MDSPEIAQGGRRGCFRGYAGSFRGFAGPFAMLNGGFTNGCKECYW